MTRTSVLLFMIWLLAGLTLAQAQPHAEPPEVDPGFASTDSVAIVGGQLVDLERGAATPNRGILVVNGRFQVVDMELSAETLDAAQTVELEDNQYLLPGLVDLHAHYNMDLVGEGRVDETAYNPLIYLANGVTTTFPAGEYDPEPMMEMRQRIDRGEQLGPRVLNSGPYIGSSNPEWTDDMDAEAIYDLVDTWAERGAQGLKAKGASPDELEPLIRRAHQHGLTVTGHLDSGFRGTTNAREAIQMGIDRVEHILGGHALDPERPAYPVWNEVDTTDADFRAIAQMFVDHEVHFTPTLTAPVYFADPDGTPGFDDWAGEQEFFTPHVRETWTERQSEATGSELMDNLHEAMLRTTKAFYDAGGSHLITLGTDKPAWGDYLPGFGAHRELHALVRAGIPEASALRIATRNGAEAIGKGDLLGSVAAGKLADLLVVEGNPLDQITNTREVELVMKAGQLYDPDRLLEAARGQIGPDGPNDHDAWGR